MKRGRNAAREVRRTCRVLSLVRQRVSKRILYETFSVKPREVKTSETHTVGRPPCHTCNVLAGNSIRYRYNPSGLPELSLYTNTVAGYVHTCSTGNYTTRPNELQCYYVYVKDLILT